MGELDCNNLFQLYMVATRKDSTEDYIIFGLDG